MESSMEVGEFMKKKLLDEGVVGVIVVGIPFPFFACFN